MATPTYRSINLTATLLGIDRRLCIVILIVTFLVFRHFTVLSALLAFVLLWSGAYWLTKHDPELVVIVPKALGQRNVYDPGKTTNKKGGADVAPPYLKLEFKMLLCGSPCDGNKTGAGTARRWLALFERHSDSLLNTIADDFQRDASLFFFP